VPELRTLRLDEPRSGVARLTLHRPDRLNAMTADLFTEHHSPAHEPGAAHSDSGSGRAPSGAAGSTTYLAMRW
jgi:hypothetical protein